MSRRYSDDELQDAYLEWVETPMHLTDQRILAWERYVDVRDGLPVGTTSLKRMHEPTGDARVIHLDLDG